MGRRLLLVLLLGAFCFAASAAAVENLRNPFAGTWCGWIHGEDPDQVLYLKISANGQVSGKFSLWGATKTYSGHVAEGGLMSLTIKTSIRSPGGTIRTEVRYSVVVALDGPDRLVGDGEVVGGGPVTIAWSRCGG